MNGKQATIRQIIAERNALLQREKELYVDAAARLNMNTRELLKNGFGCILVKNCARDFAWGPDANRGLFVIRWGLWI